MDVFITKIRKYLKEETEIEIQTIHWVGFRFINPSAPSEGVVKWAKKMTPHN